MRKEEERYTPNLICSIFMNRRKQLKVDFQNKKAVEDNAWQFIPFESEDPSLLSMNQRNFEKRI
jgi:hypothetical protein